MSIEIVNMTLDDVEEIAKLDKECFSIPWSMASFADEVINDMAIYLIAKENKKYLGYVGFWNIVGEGHITNVAVSPDVRHQGIGSMLLEEMIKTAYKLNLSLLTLEVRKSNLIAQKLYHKYGFHELGVRMRYYSDNKEDALIMTKELQ